MANEIVSLNDRLPEPVRERGIEHAQWMALSKSLYPGAAGESILMVWDYCKARRLDPLKKPCHIVPMKVKDAKTGEYRWRDVVLPGIYELRTTAQRTGQYLGHSPPEYGPFVDRFGVTAPEWCAMTIYRWHEPSKQRIEFPVKVYFAESVGLSNDKANQRWAKAPIQMLTKCTEAAGLREAFPDEFGGWQTAEEMEGQERIVEAAPRRQPATTSMEELTRAPDHPVEEAEFSEPETVVADKGKPERDREAERKTEPAPEQEKAPERKEPKAVGDVTSDEVLTKLAKAQNTDDVAAAMDLIRNVVPEQQRALKQAAVKRMQEVMA